MRKAPTHPTSSLGLMGCLWSIPQGILQWVPAQQVARSIPPGQWMTAVSAAADGAPLTTGGSAGSYAGLGHGQWRAPRHLDHARPGTIHPVCPSAAPGFPASRTISLRRLLASLGYSIWSHSPSDNPSIYLSLLLFSLSPALNLL